MLKRIDLTRDYQKHKAEYLEAIQKVCEDTAFSGGKYADEFDKEFAQYCGVPYASGVNNGTSALHCAMVALGIGEGDEVIVPANTYIATAWGVTYTGATPVFVDCTADTWEIDPDKIEEKITEKTKAIIGVHLYGQPFEFNKVKEIADRHHLYVVEDNAQSVGADYIFSDGRVRKAGTIGHIGTTSFFPSKPLACYGDGGALMTSDEALATRIRMIANHGQECKYHHRRIGCNSRLDTLQAAVLDVKLKHLEEFTETRRQVASRYDEALSSCDSLVLPARSIFSTHVYHQYTVQVKDGRRNVLQCLLKEQGIPSMIYYPVPVHHQEAYRHISRVSGNLDVSTRLCESVLSLPIHTEMSLGQQQYITETLKKGVCRNYPVPALDAG